MIKKIIILVLTLSLAMSTVLQANEKKLIDAMTEHLECYPVELLSLEKQSPSIIRQDLCLASIYHETGARPLWVSENGPSDRAAIILKYLENADKEGLDPLDYQVGQMRRLWQSRTALSLARLDTLITYNVVKYVHDIRHGQLKPYITDPNLFAEAGDRNYDPLGTIEYILQVKDLETFFQTLPPRHEQYRGLKRALALHRKKKLTTKWTIIPNGKSIRPGDEDYRVPAIRKILSSSSDEIVENINFYDGKLEEKVRQFQYFHGLEEDGIIGRHTLKDMNISPDGRIDQIKINMARWRWHDHDLGNDYILVNIANYQLYGYRNGALELTLPVIVGKLQHQTPVFSDQIKYIDFNPYWNIPPSIAVNEELVNLRKNPQYLIERNIHLFSSWQADAVKLDSSSMDWSQISESQMARFKLRQDPGPSNALGRIKFVFPNTYAVYMHDTPARDLFAKNNRSFSHGCIRVGSPEKLANFILEEQIGFDDSDVGELLDSIERKVVHVEPSLAVHITYQTAWVDKEDRIHFNRDIYGRDKKLNKAIMTK